MKTNHHPLRRRNSLIPATAACVLMHLAFMSPAMPGDDPVKVPETYEIGVITLFDDPAGVAQRSILEYVAERMNQAASVRHRAKVAFKFAD